MKLPSGACLVVSYHYVRDARLTRFPSVKGLLPQAFTSQLADLGRVCEMLDYDRLLRTIDAARTLETPCALLTFDDGLIDHYESVFPALRRERLSGTFFVSPDCSGSAARVLNVQKTQLLLASVGGDQLLREVEAAVPSETQKIPDPPAILYRYDPPADRRVKQLLNYGLPYPIVDPLLEMLFERHIGHEREIASSLYLTEAMIREMSRGGMTFGYHTHRHRVLSRLSAAAQREEIANGVQWIQSLTGQATVPFCYPHGHALAYTAETLHEVQSAGYSMAFTAVRALSQPGSDSRFELPRFDTCDVAGVLGGTQTREARAVPPVLSGVPSGGQ